MRIGVDCDDVLTGCNEAWLQWFNEHKNEHSHPPIPKVYTWHMWPDTCQECYDNCLKNPEIVWRHKIRPGAFQSLQALFEIHDLYFITHRWHQIHEETRKWLAHNDLDIFFKDVIMKSTPKRVTCEELGIKIMIDDAPHTLEDLVKSETCRPVAFTMPYNRDIECYRVSNWEEITALGMSLHYFGDDAFVGTLEQLAIMMHQAKKTGNLPGFIQDSEFQGTGDKEATV